MRCKECLTNSDRNTGNKRKIKNCSECQQIIRGRLKDIKDWEIKKKEAYQKIQEEECSTSNENLQITSYGVPYCQNSIFKAIEKYETESARQGIISVSCENCNCLLMNDNGFGDSNVNHNCKSKSSSGKSNSPSIQNHLYCRQCGKNSGKKYFCISECGRSRIDNSKTRDDYNEEVKSNYISSNNWNNKQQELQRKYGGFSMGGRLL